MTTLTLTKWVPSAPTRRSLRSFSLSKATQTSPRPLALLTSYEPTESKASSSGTIMPRVGARVELVRLLKGIRYPELLNLEFHRISSNLSYSFLLDSKSGSQVAYNELLDISTEFESGSGSSHDEHENCLMPSSYARRIMNGFYDNSDLAQGISKKRRNRKLFARTLRISSLLEKRKVDQRIFLIQTMLAERYLTERLPLVRSLDWLHRVLPNANDRIFEYHTRMTRRSFGLLLQLLETKASHHFQNSRGRKQLPIEIQLHLGIFCFGFYGNAAGFESASAKFGYSVGTIYNSRNRVVSAVISLASEYIRWPKASERKELCKRVKERYGYHSALFLVDGTTHNLAFVPKYERTSWFDRKSNYSIQALVTCDIDLRVIHLVVGWPGSTHDARVMRSADYMNKDNASEYFTGEEHGLGDAAFGIHLRVVPNYKEPLASIPENREYNLRHSSLRVKSEHVIGLVKNRFQGLKELRMKLNSKKNVRGIVNFITAGYILHNVLLTFRDEWESPVYDEDESGGSFDEFPSENSMDDPDSVDAAQLFREKVKNQVLDFIGY